MKNLTFVFVVSALVVGGCATRPAPSPAATAPGAAVSASAPRFEVLKELAGTAWVLAELDGQPVIAPPAGWDPLSLEFGREGLRATGNAGVNRFGGRYTQEGAELVFGPLALTRRLGPAELTAAEQRYTQVLSSVNGWRQDGERLILVTTGDKRAAVFERIKVAARR
jgi:heat shock protein HslJ